MDHFDKTFNEYIGLYSPIKCEIIKSKHTKRILNDLKNMRDLLPKNQQKNHPDDDLENILHEDLYNLVADILYDFKDKMDLLQKKETEINPIWHLTR